MPKSADTHAAFTKALQYSHRATWTVAVFLWQQDHAVTIPPVSVAETYQEAKHHSDAGDLYIKRKEEGSQWERVEVKRIGINNDACHFTDSESWPYPLFIIDSQHTFDNKNPTPDWYFVTNFPMTHYGLVDIRNCDRSKWVVQELLDPAVKEKRPFWLCPKSQVKFGILW